MRTTVVAAIAACLLATTACGSDDAPPPASSPAATQETPHTSAPATTPTLSKAETIEQCTEAVAEAAPGWDDWNVKLNGWQDDPRTPEVCKSLTAAEYLGAVTAGLDIAAACGTPDALPGRC